MQTARHGLAPLPDAYSKANKKPASELTGQNNLAPRVGLEPTTTRLTAAGSTIELPRNSVLLSSNKIYYTEEQTERKDFFEKFSN